MLYAYQLVKTAWLLGRWLTPVFPALGKLRQVDYFKCVASLDYVGSLRPVWVKAWSPVSQNFTVAFEGVYCHCLFYRRGN